MEETEAQGANISLLPRSLWHLPYREGNHDIGPTCEEKRYARDRTGVVKSRVLKLQCYYRACQKRNESCCQKPMPTQLRPNLERKRNLANALRE
jgi:hypothetical protein